MRSDARRWAAAAVVAAAVFGAAALAGQGGGLNVPSGALLLVTGPVCPWGTSPWTIGHSRYLHLSATAGATGGRSTTAARSLTVPVPRHRHGYWAGARADRQIRYPSAAAAGLITGRVAESGQAEQTDYAGLGATVTVPSTRLDPLRISVRPCLVD